MKKVSSTRSARLKRSIVDGDLSNTRPLRVPGATVTAGPEAVEPDLANLAAEPVRGATVAGSAAAAAGAVDPAAQPNRRRAVLLSDGTRITFDTTRQFDDE